MKLLTKTLFVLIISLSLLNCYSQNKSFKSKTIYKTKTLEIIQISENAFVHISFLQTNDFGNVPCNGLIVKNNNEIIIFDTPTNNDSSDELINWANNTFHSKIIAVLPTHFHNDCLGGLKSFHNHKIPSYANAKTIELAKQNNYEIPQNGFENSLILKIGTETIIAKFFGEGHTKDDVVIYFPSEKILFGGCLIKEVNANKGYLGDANILEWSNTVKKVKKEYPDVKIVIPGHGKFGNQKLLDYTIDLFKLK